MHLTNLQYHKNRKDIKERDKIRSKNRTSSSDGKTEFKNNTAQVAAETGLVGAIDGDDEGVAGLLPALDLHNVLVRHHHLSPQYQTRRRSRRVGHGGGAQKRHPSKRRRR